MRVIKAFRIRKSLQNRSPTQAQPPLKLTCDSPAHKGEGGSPRLLLNHGPQDLRAEVGHHRMGVEDAGIAGGLGTVADGDLGAGLELLHRRDLRLVGPERGRPRTDPSPRQPNPPP